MSIHTHIKHIYTLYIHCTLTVWITMWCNIFACLRFSVHSAPQRWWCTCTLLHTCTIKHQQLLRDICSMFIILRNIHCKCGEKEIFKIMNMSIEIHLMVTVYNFTYQQLVLCCHHLLYQCLNHHTKTFLSEK